MRENFYRPPRDGGVEMWASVEYRHGRGYWEGVVSLGDNKDAATVRGKSRTGAGDEARKFLKSQGFRVDRTS